jgi:hypothetical protein
VVPCEWDEEGIDKDNVLEVVDDRLSIQEVVCHDKEVPVERFTPGVFIFRVDIGLICAIYD